MAYELVWTVQQRDFLRRALELDFADRELPHRNRTIEFITKRFMEDTTLYPLEWPTSHMPTEEENWEWGLLSIRYRRNPSAQAIEILSIELRGNPSGSCSRD